MKKAEWNEKIEQYPQLASKLETLKDVWAETFPNRERDMKRR